jgi:thiol-disulfide isomerase/thioredoxin
MDLSGHERDKLFLSRSAKNVVDVSYLSGADGVEDARTFAKADLDRDGFEDMIVVNRNAPLLRIYRNQLGPSTKNHFLGIRVEGAHQHEAIGARLTARGCGVTQTRELAGGTGFATVDAMTVTLGLGTCTKLDEVTVKFPGAGERRTFKNVAVDSFYRVVEGKGIQAVPGVYGRSATAAIAPSVTKAHLAKLATTAQGHAPLVLVDVYATWCEACVRTAPRLDALATVLADQLDVVGVSVEPTDDAAAVAKFRSSHSIAHPLLTYDEAVASEVNEQFGGSPALPSTLVIDRKTGAIVLSTRGVPTRSELERAIWLRH